MYYHDPKQRKSKEIAPGVRIRTFWGERMTLSLAELDEGSVVPTHTHPQEQVGIALKGRWNWALLNLAASLRREKCTPSQAV